MIRMPYYNYAISAEQQPTHSDTGNLRSDWNTLKDALKEAKRRPFDNQFEKPIKVCQSCRSTPKHLSENLRLKD